MRKMLVSILCIVFVTIVIGGMTSKIGKERGEIVRVHTKSGVEAWHCVQVDDDKFMCEVNK